MDITVDPEECEVTFGLDLVLPAREERRVVIISGPNARGAKPKALDIECSQQVPSSVADVPGAGNTLEASNGGDVPLDGAIALTDPEFAVLGGRYGNDIISYLDFSDLLTAHVDDENVQYTPSGSSSYIYHSTSSTHETVQVQQPLSYPKPSIPPVPTQAIRSLVKRPNMGTGTHRVAKLILHNLKSYSQMMLAHNMFPPFIHPAMVSSDICNPDFEPLANCIDLVHMIGSGIQASRRLFWKNVRMECERFCDEHLKLNKWELLAAMQALSIYIIIRLDEGETEYNNFDLLLLKTITALSKQLSGSELTKNVTFALHNSDPNNSWKEWTFEESRRRLCVIYRVVNMLVYFEPAAMCGLQTDLIIAPLPAKKQLWEAGNELVWKAESEKEPGIQTPFGLAANGDLVKLGKPFATRGSANWEEWCSGMDGLGGLIMLAASLIG
ncbi:hypothetical protein ANOM_005732 [Aspergillus nomiae NRRL 13137]|uniref:Transcription factor domain-containing protein n=1 Tax=Aspergillus nomiae NRRL (strain ATCC 15546 / NRRL 13137 / CBS 260.88 / M93) TaxID=1509407 RepID=A0A0L1J252_ASPN3|nr:uncharacterized protein ANOM_005732 [Aspergillus nomiae NRRL 13137]KNG85755.1 hypothetical protein ANOM_005732 [Aspergillus nomiae NRRL 13137]